MGQDEDHSQKYQKLSELDHVLQRPSIYVGSTTNTEMDTWLVSDDSKSMEKRHIEYNPGLLKLVDEILSNAVDEHKRSGAVKSIDLSINEMTGSITITDDGGIPVQKHNEYGTWIPSMIFGELRTGSNFDDESRIGAGMNGLGAKLTSIFSTYFNVTTCDGKKIFKQVFEDNLKTVREPEVSNSKSNSGYTIIEFVPDFERFRCELDQDNVERIRKRVYDVAGCNSEMVVSFNNERINIRNFKDYAQMFTDSKIAETYNNEWDVIVGPSFNDEFEHVSFVNGVDTFNGGTHIDYVTSQITSKLREYIKKKHKIDVKPNNIKQQLFIFVNCTINAPDFTSQTKEYLSTDSKNYQTSITIDDDFIKKLVKSEVVQKVLDWAEAQRKRQEMAELRKMNKQTSNNNYLKKIVKFDDATTKRREDASLLIVEGDSAGKSILSARDPQTQAVYPLKGKPINVRDMKIKKLTENKEFADLLSIIGLKFGEEHSIDDLRFGRLIVATDSDVDGQHILGLIINMFQQFWPNLLKEGFVHRLNTPLIVAKTKKGQKEFFNRESYESWKGNAPKHSMKYYKGLGTWSSKDFKRFLDSKNFDHYLDRIEIESNDDLDAVDLAFDKSRADDRKDWLAES